MNVKFTKMHGLGNDFMVVDAINQEFNPTPKTIESLANRHTGIGFDQCLIIKSSNTINVDFLYQIYNADGQEVGQCGNGARCVARFIKKHGLSNKQTIKVATKTCTMQLTNNPDGTATVSMGKPQQQPASIPLIADTQQAQYTLQLSDDTTCKLHTISVGNPHAVVITDNIDLSPVNTLGKQLSEHHLFPEQTNVGFMQIINPNHIKLRVYERGCGETMACGSGAVAAAAIGRLYHQLAENVKVSLPGGDLTVNWNHFDDEIYLTGPATFVYDGQLL